MIEEYRLGDLAERVAGTVQGDPERIIRGITTLELAGPDQLSFLTNPRYRKLAEQSKAGALIVAPGASLPGHDLLEVAQPQLALASLLELFAGPAERRTGISPLALIAEDVQLGQDLYVGPFTEIDRGAVICNEVSLGAGCVVGRNCRIGERTELRPAVVLYPETQIGADCLIHSGTVLGADGYGFVTVDGIHQKIPQLGRVVVEDKVEIGANCTLDRGALGETRIGAGSKLDNLVMIAHGVQVGAGALMAAQTGIAGSSRLGERTTWAGQSGAAGHLEVGEGTVVAAKSAVFNDTDAGSFVAGIPAVDHGQWKRSQALLKKLPQMRRELRDLRDRLQVLESKLGQEED